jgi:hypothetical protein
MLPFYATSGSSERQLSALPIDDAMLEVDGVIIIILEFHV